MKEKNMNIYQKNGFANRKAYLVDLAEQNGIEYETVQEIASVLGENEDFDGLINALEEASNNGF